MDRLISQINEAEKPPYNETIYSISKWSDQLDVLEELKKEIQLLNKNKES